MLPAAIQSHIASSTVQTSASDRAQALDCECCDLNTAWKQDIDIELKAMSDAQDWVQGLGAWRHLIFSWDLQLILDVVVYRRG
jgi:hypothetical protein